MTINNPFKIPTPRTPEAQPNDVIHNIDNITEPLMQEQLTTIEQSPEFADFSNAIAPLIV